MEFKKTFKKIVKETKPVLKKIQAGAYKYGKKLEAVGEGLSEIGDDAQEIVLPKRKIRLIKSQRYIPKNKSLEFGFGGF